MKKLFTIMISLVMMSITSYGQGKVVLGQYFQNLPAFSPAFTGANDYLDIKTGFRKQWAGFDGAPGTVFLSAYSPIGQKYSASKPTEVDSNSEIAQNYEGGKIKGHGIKMGTGGYFLIDDQGPFQELEAMLNFATYVPVRENMYLSLGISGGILNSKIDLDEITVKDDINDETYLSFISNGDANSFFNLNAGIGLHSDKFYAGYSAMQLTRTFISGNKDVNNEGANLRHHILGGFRVSASEQWELIPNTFLRIESGQPFFYELGVRARHNNNLWFGAAYRNDKTFVGMVGMALNESVNFGYAYEYKNSEFDNFNNGSHEIILGLRFFNRSATSSLW